LYGAAEKVVALREAMTGEETLVAGVGRVLYGDVSVLEKGVLIDVGPQSRRLDGILSTIRSASKAGRPGIRILNAHIAPNGPPTGCRMYTSGTDARLVHHEDWSWTS
jgi:hypothetical protein